MTDERVQPTRRPGVRSSRPVYLAYGGASVAFAGVLVALAWQVASGADPAIGAGEQAAAQQPVQRVVVRRVVRRVIVTRRAPADPTAPAQQPAAAAPAAAAPAAAASAPAPAPAPAPPPPTTSAS